MAERVTLHVGTMKSGTTYLERRLEQNRGALAEQGILFPGSSWGAQVHAVGDLLGRERLGGPGRSGAWQRLVDEIDAWRGAAVVSVELLGSAAPARVQAAVDSFLGTDLDIVLTARDLNRAIPSMWQESLKNGRAHTWEEYVEGVRLREGPGKQFWREQGLARIARAWSERVGPEHVTVVTVPPPGGSPELLWDRYCSVVGIRPDSCAAVLPANESLGATSALVMLRLNQLLAESEIPWPSYDSLVKRGLAKNVLAGRRGREKPIAMPLTRWVAARAREQEEALRALGVNIVGDLTDLRPVPVKGAKLRTVGPEDQLAAALEGLAGVIARQARKDDAARNNPGSTSGPASVPVVS